MQGTDPAYRYRNDVINLMVEAYNIPSWKAFCYAGNYHFTKCYEDAVALPDAIDRYFDSEKL